VASVLVVQDLFQHLLSARDALAADEIAQDRQKARKPPCREQRVGSSSSPGQLHKPRGFPPAEAVAGIGQSQFSKVSRLPQVATRMPARVLTQRAGSRVRWSGGIRGPASPWEITSWPRCECRFASAASLVAAPCCGWAFSLLGCRCGGVCVCVWIRERCRGRALSHETHLKLRAHGHRSHVTLKALWTR
jgi:hypothetical protein